MSEVEYTVFGRANCKWCDKAVALLEEDGRSFNYFGIDTNPVLKNVILGMGIETVPAIFQSSIYIGGYEDMKRAFDLAKFVGENYDLD